MNVIVEKKKRKDFMKMAEDMDWVTAVNIIGNSTKHQPEEMYMAVAYSKGYEDSLKFMTETEEEMAKEKKEKKSILSKLKKDLRTKNSAVDNINIDSNEA